MITGLQPAELPHSDIAGSKVVCTYPTLFAAYHVLHRLPEPRHPPFALFFLFLCEIVVASHIWLTPTNIYIVNLIFRFAREVILLLRANLSSRFRNHTSNSINLLSGGLAQLARAPALQAGGQGFDSLILHPIRKNQRSLTY